MLNSVLHFDKLPDMDNIVREGYIPGIRLFPKIKTCPGKDANEWQQTIFKKLFENNHIRLFTRMNIPGWASL